MAKPRVFISSTYYDLKHLRSSLDNFVESLGFEPVLSEKGDIAYSPDAPLDESCYREASSADIFVLIIGGRYGSQTSSEQKKPTQRFFDQYDSITKQEYRHAVSRDVPIYILIDSSVYAEYRTFLKNRSSKTITYAHVDSVNIFHLIEDILRQPKNNPIFAFDRYSEVEEWLREQWAGLFKEMLGRLSGMQQIATLSSKVSELGEINLTLRRYLETIVTKVSPTESKDIIESESKRLNEAQQLVKFQQNNWVKHMMKSDFSLGACMAAIRKAQSFNQFAEILRAEVDFDEELNSSAGMLGLDLKDSLVARHDFNYAREIIGLRPLNEMV